MLKSSQKTCIIQDGRRKIHYTFTSDNELAEEYDIKTNELVGECVQVYTWLKTLHVRKFWNKIKTRMAFLKKKPRIDPFIRLNRVCRDDITTGIHLG